jgi:hypothetical protein
MTALAITYAANTTVPVTWTTPAGTTATAHMPTQLHATYASDTHTTTVVQLADATQQVPQQAPALTGGQVGLGGGALIGLSIVIWFAARWRHHGKEIKTWFFMGVAAATLIGSWGLFGTVTNTVRSTGDSVGNSVSNTLGQQTSYGH